jgi:hypothetical protein
MLSYASVGVQMDAMDVRSDFAQGEANIRVLNECFERLRDCCGWCWVMDSEDLRHTTDGCPSRFQPRASALRGNLRFPPYSCCYRCFYPQDLDILFHPNSNSESLCPNPTESMVAALTAILYHNRYLPLLNQEYSTLFRSGDAATFGVWLSAGLPGNWTQAAVVLVFLAKEKEKEAQMRLIH